MPENRPAKPVDYLVLILIPLLSSITPIAVAAAVAHIPAILAGGIRFTIAGLGLLILLSASGRLKKIDRKDWPRIVLLAIICVPVNQYAFFEGVRLSNSSHGGIIYAATPVIVTVAMCLLKVERWTVAAIGGAVLAVAGVVVIMMQSLWQQSATNAFWKGDLLLVVAVTTWSFYLVFSRPLTLRYSALNAQMPVFLVGAVLSIPLLGKDLATMQWAEVTWQSWAGLAYLSIMVACVVFFLFNWAMTRQPPSRVATFSNAAPPLTLLWNALMHKGELSVWFLLGSALLLAGMVCALRKAKIMVAPEEGALLEENTLPSIQRTLP